MKHPITIAGRDVELEWTQEQRKRYIYRLQVSGGHPTQAQLRNTRTAPAAYCRILWALLPKDVAALYSDPEELFVAIDHETEAEGIYDGIAAIYADMNPDAEKKSTTGKSPSQESNSD